jgi:hypothetical protein
MRFTVSVLPRHCRIRHGRTRFSSVPVVVEAEIGQPLAKRHWECHNTSEDKAP